MGNFPDQGSNLCPLQWKHQLLTSGPPGTPRLLLVMTVTPESMIDKVCFFLPPHLTLQRRQWLQEAMSAAFRGQREEVEQMKNCLRVLSQPTPSSAGEAELATDQQEREGALELLADLCENMDNAAGTASPPRPAPRRQGPAPSAFPSASVSCRLFLAPPPPAPGPAAAQPFVLCLRHHATCLLPSLPASPLQSGSDSGPS